MILRTGRCIVRTEGSGTPTGFSAFNVEAIWDGRAPPRPILLTVSSRLSRFRQNAHRHSRALRCTPAAPFHTSGAGFWLRETPPHHCGSANTRRTAIPFVLERFFTFPTGFADVQVGPDGCMYLTNGPYLSSRILRLSPVAPAFASIPAPDAVQGIPYSYTPVFTGTPPDLTVLEGPEGMTVDSASRRVLWTPTKGQARSQLFPVTLGAQNGAGSTRQSFELRVINTNDPPESFNLGMAAGAEVLNFLGTDPHVTFRWAQATDPDGDSLTYLVELDSTVSFDSPAHRVFSAGSADSLHVPLPRISGTYYWRVIATDGRLSTHSTPPYATMSIAFLPAPGIKVATERPPASPLEQNFPNPFNPSTSISYTIQRQGYVRLSVFNLLGQEVSRVFEGIQPEGKYTVAFNNLEPSQRHLLLSPAGTRSV